MNEYERQLGGSGNGDPQARGRSPEEIEREIEATRERMGRDIDELGERLSPQQPEAPGQGRHHRQGAGHRQQRRRSARYTGVSDDGLRLREHLAGGRDGAGRRVAHPAAQQERDLRRPDGAVRLYRTRASQRGHRRQDRRPGRAGRALGQGKRELGRVRRRRAGQRSRHPGGRDHRARQGACGRAGRRRAAARARSRTRPRTAAGRREAASSGWSRRTRWRWRRASWCWASPPGCWCPRASGSSGSWGRRATTWSTAPRRRRGG